jgi:hypothetical protein
VTRFGSEHLQAADICGPYTNTYIPLRIAPDSVFRLDPCPSAWVLSQLVDHDLAPLAPGVVLYQNARGGRIALLPYVLHAVSGSLTHMISYHRRHMLKAIVDWMNPGVPPVWVEEPSLIAVQTWDDGRRLTVCLVNTSYDTAESLTVLMPGDLSPENASTINPKGRPVALGKRITRSALEGGKARWTIRATLAAFDPFLLIVNR